MRDDSQRTPIDVDALVTALLKGQTEEEPTTVTTAVAPVVEKELPPAPQAPAKRKPEKKAAKNRFFKNLFPRRDEEPDAVFEESWADWGLKPIGHYHVDADTQILTSVNGSLVEETSAETPAQAPTEEPADVVTAASAVTDEPAIIVTTTQEPPTVVEEPAVPVVVEEEPPAVAAEEATPTPAPVTEVDEFPAVRAVEETITLPPIPTAHTAVDDVTRVLDIPADEAAPAPAQPLIPAADGDQLPNQLTLEEYLRVEDVEDAAPVSDEDPEERLQRARQERVRDFTFGGDEEEPNEPEEEAVPTVDEEEPEIEDFTDYKDTKAVQLELRYRSRAAMLTMLFTGVLELVMLLLTLMTLSIGQSPITEMGYLTVQLFGLVLMLVLNFPAVSRGLSGLFALHANGDTGAALAVCVALCNTILHFINFSQSLPLWAPVAGLLMLLNAVGRFVREECIRHNFEFVSYPGEKYTACLIEDEKALHEIGRRAVIEGEAEVAYFRRADFLGSYLSNANEDDRADGWMRWMLPISFGCSLLVSLLMLFSGSLHGFWDWMRAFTGMLCVALPTVSLSVQLAMSQCSRYMLSKGGFMVGWKAVKQFGNPDALAVDLADLYPDESMLLHGIKTFGGTHIDDAILDAASLAVRSEGPLSLIFRRIIENKESLLRTVDNLVYEQGMGLSGWVNDRRVLVGNRRLLQHHGVDVPSSDYEARYAKDGRRLLYLAVAGELSAMFVVSYLPDAEIKKALQDLCRAKVTLLVRSCDPNITAEDLCRDFELDDYYVDMLPSAAGRLYTQLTEGEAQEAPAVLASNGHILGSALAMSVCRSLQVKALIALLVQSLLAALGVVLCVFWIGKGLQVYFLSVLAYTVLSAVLAWLLPVFRRL